MHSVSYRLRQPGSYARWLDRRRRHTREAKEGRACKVCGESIAHLKALARYCSVRCQKRWLYEHGERERRGSVKRPPPGSLPKRPPKPAPVPIPDVPSGHDVYDEARAALTGWERQELGSDMDSGVRDLMQCFALAWLEGEDPAAAVRRERGKAIKERLATIHGLSLVDDLER